MLYSVFNKKREVNSGIKKFCLLVIYFYNYSYNNILKILSYCTNMFLSVTGKINNKNIM